ncbi:MAG: ATP-binding cassette domain-containing protein [Deltaproteobacteria bacterium]|nr:ATP-binding cassette domain-containing protein [Deltaproteobacteria bacterium]
MIEARDLSKSYGQVDALKDVSFEVSRGEVLGFLGPNGAGKTTTMKILTCFIAPSGGTASINGADVFDDPMGVRRSIGYLPESTPLYTEMLVLEYLEFVAKMRGYTGTDARKRIKKAVEQTSLGDVIAKEIRQLSKGFRQRVGLAQALVHEPPVLILDEPMSGLDPNQASEIRDLIKEIGRERTVILSTHDLGEVQVTCDRVLIISKGRLVADDTPEELRERSGKASYRVTVADDSKGDEKRIRDLLGKVKGVDRVRPRTADAKGELIFAVSPSGSEDLRRELFQAAVDGGFVLLGLEKKAEGLDAVFRDLTTREADEPKKRKKKKATADDKKAEARAKKKARDEAKKKAEEEEAEEEEELESQEEEAAADSDSDDSASNDSDAGSDDSDADDDSDSDDSDSDSDDSDDEDEEKK